MSGFTKRDLALLLPDTNPGDAYSLRHTSTGETTEAFTQPKPKVDASKRVSRYRAGQAPKWAEEEPDVGFVGKIKDESLGKKKAASLQRRVYQPQVISVGTRKNIDDATGSEEFGERREASESRRERVEASESSSESSKAEESESEDEAEITTRRQQLKARIAKKNAEEQVPVKEGDVSKEESAQKSDGEPSSSSATEWETDSDDPEAVPSQKILKPLFVPKSARRTKAPIEDLEVREEVKFEDQRMEVDRRKKETKQMIEEVIRREKEDTDKDRNSTDVEMPDDTDGLDPEQEYKDWKIRELTRIKRDRQRREAAEVERLETLRRRNMTDEERRMADMELGKGKNKEKAKLKFLQKYYHKGAFYMDESSVKTTNDVRRRDASGATLEDKFDREALPKVMQVKNFGKSGRTKYTHLADQDTTDRSSLRFKDDRLSQKYQEKMSGVGDLDRDTRVLKRPKRD